jgi:hypothetical protein
MKLLHIPSADPFSCHIFEVNEFPKDDDLFIMKCHELDDFIGEVLNPNGDSPLLGIETDEAGIEFIEFCYLPGVQHLKKPEA